MAAAQWLLSRHSHQNETAAIITMEGDYLTTSDPAFHGLLHLWRNIILICICVLLQPEPERFTLVMDDVRLPTTSSHRQEGLPCTLETSPCLWQMLL